MLHRIKGDCDDDGVNLAVCFHFVCDRTRCLRNDTTQYELCFAEAVKLAEQCGRIHIHYAVRLVVEEPIIFDQKTNMENLTKCMQSLKYMYHDLG